MPVQQLTIWDGTSPSRSDPTVFRRPDGADWLTIIEEVQRTQRAAFDQPILSAGQMMTAGQPFYMAADGLIYPADHISFPEVAGITTAGGAVTVLCRTSGLLRLAGWGLTAGAAYFLAGPGMISTSVPTTGYVVELGIALDSDTLDVKIRTPLRL